MIYFTSDTHVSHTNIAGPKVSKWESGYRNFDSVEQMDGAIIDSINSTVGENDILYHLGDWSFGGAQNIETFRSMLNVKTIHLVFGNHDQHIFTNAEYQKLFSSCASYREITVKDFGLKQKIVMCHYPMYQWNQNHRGSWMLSGHCHHNEPFSHHKTSQYKIMDVGWDYFRKPISVLEIAEIMENKLTKRHH